MNGKDIHDAMCGSFDAEGNSVPPKKTYATLTPEEKIAYLEWRIRSLQIDIEELLSQRRRLAIELDSVGRTSVSRLEETERLKKALQDILEFDMRSMYARCPDCDHDEWCKQHKTCKSCPTSKVGDIAKTALEDK